MLGITVHCGRLKGPARIDHLRSVPMIFQRYKTKVEVKPAVRRRQQQVGGWIGAVDAVPKGGGAVAAVSDVV